MMCHQMITAYEQRHNCYSLDTQCTFMFLKGQLPLFFYVTLLVCITDVATLPTDDDTATPEAATAEGGGISSILVSSSPPPEEVGHDKDPTSATKPPENLELHVGFLLNLK